MGDTPAEKAALAENALLAIMDILSVHRWKSMGTASVECECCAIIYGDGTLTQFPADEAFRRHLAEKILDTARETQRRFWAAGFAAGQAAAAPVLRQEGATAERQRIRQAAIDYWHRHGEADGYLPGWFAMLLGQLDELLDGHDG